jgi:phage-related protein (TIGR01555 family)
MPSDAPLSPPVAPEPALLDTCAPGRNSLARRLDGWVNATTGLGGVSTDRAAALNFEADPIPSAMLIDRLYTSDWLAARIVEKMPSIALVRGFGVRGQESDDLLRSFERLNTTERFPEGAFQRAIFDGRAYGGAGLFLGYELGDPTAPLTPEIERGGLAFLDVFLQHELRVLTRVTDPKRPDFGMPELYEVIGSQSGVQHPRRGQKFHASRLLRTMGRPLRVQYHPELEPRPEVGVSVLAPVLKDIARYGTSWAAVSHLLQDASIGVMKISGLVEALASEDQAIVQDRLRTLQQTKSLTRLLFLDAEEGEEFSRVAVSFADVPGVMAQIILSISGAADMPAKILFGTSPMGLNANSAGEADLTQFYNSVDEYRRRVIGPHLEKVLRAVANGADVRIEWPSLWEPSENEKAQTRLTNANATRAYWDMGAVQAKDIVKAAQTNVLPETIGTVSDERAPDPVGEGAGAAPQGAPGSKLAAALASAGRSADGE